MTEPAVPAENLSPRWAGGRRTEPPRTGDERATLTAFLDWHRATLEAKCAGVAPERLSEFGVPPSGLSLHGIVRHLAAAERWWFRIQFAGEDVPMLYYTDDDPDQDFTDLGGDTGEALAVWRAECARSREIVAAAPGLDTRGARPRSGEPFTLRWLLVHLIAEYARHNGHADLLRERIDGTVGA
ncbi:DinB family protein [Prauserella shujinwangii]|uniref:DinB family protein n=1 Tax=Prauserella shujinwangii TaxID=1453103 RepID=UPI000D07AE43|nr:DinB family protein [Prauserella shujinwangii]